MTWHVFITTPRAGCGSVVSPYTVECKEVFATRELAQAFADAKTLNQGVVNLFNAMPSLFPEWTVGTITNGKSYPLNSYWSLGGVSYKCKLGHVNYGDTNWAPNIATTMWEVVPNPGLTEWVAGVNFLDSVAYPDPVLRTYKGRLYQLQIRHGTQVGWEPDITPALWIDKGPADSYPAYTKAWWTVVSSEDFDYAEIVRGIET